MRGHAAQNATFLRQTGWFALLCCIFAALFSALALCELKNERMQKAWPFTSKSLGTAKLSSS
ncbi:hypothetical protein [Paenibacillus roseipurpureus]|uniref:Uncharacterized protein n=1 Tax=Paenibacillus roseopurpureus TaxID=2918901 RepID=A0AA96LPL6_9BACL|nr:hypothetical protein [Paenibacillus sp. MBLB1832]WNR43644.1 hypothetical protein MJB10_21465 [Paenibacillus sp. MBLB1832]